MAYSLRARVVYPVDRPPIEWGVVTVDGERLVAVGREAAASDVIELDEAALLPGLVNTHTHLEFSHLRRPLGEPGMRLVDWIRLVLAERNRGRRADVHSVELGLEESVARGVTAIGDITAGAAASLDARSLDKQLPNPGDVDLTLFHEVIGFSRARAVSAFAAVSERLAKPAAWPHGPIGLSPHAPYTVSPELLRRLIALARSREMPVAMHVAESAEELELLRDENGPFAELLAERGMWDAEAIPSGSRPLRYLQMLAEAPRALVIHGNYLDEEERAFLAANADRMSLVYCPRTHAYFGHPPYPLAESLAAGVRVALGTDSRASNPDLGLLAEMRFVVERYAAIDPEVILRMGTLEGATALGRDRELGSITPGKLANLAAVRLPDDARGTPRDLLAALLAGRDAPCGTWLRGERIAPA